MANRARKRASQQPTSPPSDVPPVVHARGSVTDWLIAAATIGNVAVACLLWRTTKAATETTAKMMRAQQMPYVAMESIRVDNDKDDTGMLVALDLKNYGTGAAYGVTVKWVPVFDGNSLKPEEPANPVPFLMPPGSTHPYGQLPILGENYRLLMAVKARLEMSIDLTFKDAEGATYHTHYAIEHKPSGIQEPGPLHHIWFGKDEWCKDDTGRPCGASE